MPHIVPILFLFALGACVGSFLNVVVWRLPRDESLVTPPSRCPKCGHKLAWFDNIPVFGWIFLKGKCRYCQAAISSRYPIIEAITGLLFVFYYVMFFMFDIGPCGPTNVRGQSGTLLPLRGAALTFARDWPVYAMYMFLIACLLAASLIDAELFIIPPSIPWWAAGVGIVGHAIFDRPNLPGSSIVSPPVAALSAGAAVGLLISILLLRLKILPMSFAEGGPLLEHEKEELESHRAQAARDGIEAPPEAPIFTPAQIRGEMRKEMLFLMPPMVLSGLWALAMIKNDALSSWWGDLLSMHWLAGGLGALWGALIGGFVVWITRILGSYGFGREAMGLGDVHLMFGVGAVVGAGASTVSFFVAPFFGILIAIYMILTGKKRELPYGPYLSLATAFVMLAYCPIAAQLAPGIDGLVFIIQRALGQS